MQHRFRHRCRNDRSLFRGAAHVLAALLIFSALPFAGAAAEDGAPPPGEAEAFIRNLSDEGFSIWRDPANTRDVRERKFRDLLHRDFAVNLIAKLVLGRHARAASRDQLVEYLDLFPVYTVNTFARRMGDYNDERLEVLGTAPAGERDIFVRTKLDGPGSGEPLAADWRIRRIDGRLQVIDVKVEGISMAITQREEFGSIITRDGFEGLLSVLRKGAKEEPASTG